MNAEVWKRVVLDLTCLRDSSDGRLAWHDTIVHTNHLHILFVITIDHRSTYSILVVLAWSRLGVIIETAMQQISNAMPGNR